MKLGYAGSISVTYKEILQILTSRQSSPELSEVMGIRKNLISGIRNKNHKYLNKMRADLDEKGKLVKLNKMGNATRSMSKNKYRKLLKKGGSSRQIHKCAFGKALGLETSYYTKNVNRFRSGELKIYPEIWKELNDAGKIHLLKEDK